MRWLAVPVLLFTLLTPAGAEDRPVADPHRLTLEDLFENRRAFSASVPRWDWRPGHAELVRVDTQEKPPRAALVALDVETGVTRDLLDLRALEALVAEPAGEGERASRGVRGVGRAGPPRVLWAASGTALCAVVRGDLVWADLATGTKRRLTTTDAPMADINIAPDGAHVSFSRKNELWVVAAKAGAPRQLTTGSSRTLLNGTLDWVYPEELGYRTAAWWSPDGTQLAYLQLDQAKVPTYRLPALLPLRGEGREMFYPKAGDPNPAVRVGVVPAAGGATRWIDLGTPAPEYVVRVGWVRGAGEEPTALPLVVTADRAQRTLVGRLGFGPPAAQEPALRDETPTGWLTPPPVPVAAGERAILWRSEVASRPGFSTWQRLALDEQGCFQRTALTPAGVDADALLHFDPATQRLIYAATPADSHTPGVFLGGPGATSLVRAPFAADAALGTTAQVDDTGTYALVTTSNVVTPPRTFVARVVDGEVIREIGDARGPALDDVALAVPEYGEIPVGTLGRIRWRLWRPADFDPARSYGLIVHVYGGPGSRMVNDTWGRGPMFPTLLGQRGYLVLEVDGRGTSGQGAAWMHAVYGRLGLLELEDQATAVQHILTRGYVDPMRVGIWGWSYGGTMACNALTMRGDVFRAGVAVAPVTDWRLYDTIYTERYMGLPAENPDGYRDTSAVTHAQKMTGQLLVMHGLGDDNVHAQNTLRLVEAFLAAKNAGFEWMLYPKRGHGIEGVTLDVFRRLLAHFERHLPPAAAPR
ncbi:MAG: prolyl oligopeptidase family serine peptidase [Planctomycetota bacterium]|nr:prolyl oligopeptidase family serine peptidase [Planctomycetota bacterium]